MWKSHLGDWKSKFIIEVLWGRTVASVEGPCEICSPKIKVRTRHTDMDFLKQPSAVWVQAASRQMVGVLPDK